MNKNEIGALIEKINAYDTIIIFRHVRPDPDALGSQLGFKYAIQKLFPNKHVYAVGSSVDNLSFIGEMDEINDEIFTDALGLVLDTANAPRIDDERYKMCKSIIKIDHHPPVDQYGEINVVNTDSSSTSEIIYEILLNIGYGTDLITREIARCLYIGIVGDTGRFLFNNTTSKTMAIASELLKYDIDHTQMINQMQQRDLTSIRFQGYVLQHFKFEDGVGYIFITKEILEQFNISASAASLFVNSLADTQGIKAWAFAIDETSEIRVRLRSKDVVINTLAAEYNGGGHPLASGASVYSVEELERLIAQLKALVNA
ncbi:DHH family phosphoesterase [Macrococcoides bohemicum]|uniref:DHH family phosphoesterase n=1 Tax=Macrococcoides bohemicum TaxID=1903056 RepID=A0A328A8K7_9STAP|nr:bifunctional oligoribonuclease/PAP phosphatase NrnA [Macrococcus bohemicus]QRN50283.1 bifunctional oligoribonuclease/PAP phosphatase NrnA [Macrococcus bohemicus]QYA44130.1 bifunctional oligoribonuclease/PAP phosphatase NrnA [Macrococcus bohemicus]RAK50104.1 DHH family phosphoesterase [Macrococcus bohemicus]